jgi:hypothetical protein
MTRLAISALLIGLAASPAWAQSTIPPHTHLIYRTEHGARLRCPNDNILWASTRTHTVYQPGDHHFGHTRGGFMCESDARAHGYKGPIRRA